MVNAFNRNDIVKKNNALKLFSILFAIVLTVYLLLPSSYYSYHLNIFVFVQYLISTVLFWKFKNKCNYFDFDVVFQLVFLFVMFIYPVFLYEYTPYSLSLFKYPFNENVISKASILALLGMHAYYLGSLSFKENRIIVDNENKEHGTLNNGILILLFTLIFFLFVITGGLSTFSALYGGGGGGSGITYYLLIILSALLSVSISISLYKHQNMQLGNLSSFKLLRNLCYTDQIMLLLVATFVVLMLLVGSRTYPIQFLLLLLGAYSQIKSISLKQFLFLSTFGGILMFYVLVLRSGIDSSSVNYGLLDIFSDLIINNRNTYVAIDYVDRFGITWGESMLLSVCSPIPFLQSVVCNLFNLNPTDLSSSFLITKLSLGVDSNFDLGFGTNIIADLYIAFGLIGVIVGMFVLGYFISYLSANSRNNIYTKTGYLVLMSYSIYIVRAEYFVFLRMLIWSLCIVNVIKHHPIGLVWQRKKF